MPIKKDYKSVEELPESHKAYSLLRSQGYNNNDACKVLKITPTYGSMIKKNLKKFDLRDEKLVRKAHKAINLLVQGKTFNDIKHVKDSTTLAAANMIYDRYQPKVTINNNLNVNTDISPVNLMDYATSTTDNADNSGSCDVRASDRLSDDHD